MSRVKNILGKLFGTKAARDLKDLKPIIDKVNQKSPAIIALSDDELRAKTLEFKELIAKATTLEDAEIKAIQASLDKEEVAITERKQPTKL